MNRNAWILLATAGLALPSIAQDKQPTPPPSKLRMIEKMEQDQIAAAVRRINIEFPGGKLREYVAALREATRPETVNVVAPESLLNMRLGEISLREVDIQTAVKALEWAAEPRGTMMVQILAPNSFGVANGRFEQEIPGTRQPQASQIHVLSLRDLTETLPGEQPNSRLTVEPDVVLTAVRTAIQSGDKADSAELKYHSDSGLLIVRGTPGQIDAASNVLDRMLTDMRTRRKAVRDAMVGQANLDEMKAEAEKQIIRADLLEANFARAREEMAKVEEMKKQGAASTDDATSARASLDRAKAEMEAARIDRSMAHARLESMQKRMTEAATQEKRGTEDRLGEIPQGRSVVEYMSTTVTGKDLKATATALDSLVEQLLRGESTVNLVAEGDTLVVTGGQEAQRLVRRTLLDAANPSKGPFVQKSKPKSVDEKSGR